MTEEDAKTKWCPMCRSAGWGGEFSANRGKRGDFTDDECCVASACMMWRWNSLAMMHGHGYCGIAGRPANA